MPGPVQQQPTTFFVNQPKSVGFNAFENPPVTVGVVDSFGNAVPGASVSIALNNGGNGATLSGTTVQLTDGNGVATFADVSINKAGTYTLTAFAPGFQPSGSGLFAVLGSSGSLGVATTHAAGTHPFGIVQADFNANFLPDVAVANQNSNSVTVFDNQTQTQGGTIGLVPVQTLVSGLGPTAIASADLNQSGFPAIVTANSGTTTVSVFQNVTAAVGAQPVFNTVPLTLSIGHTPVALAIGDVTGDGLQDIVTANNDGTVSIFTNTSGVNGAPSFTGPQTIVLLSPVALGGIAIGDFNADRAQDIVVTRPTSQAVTVLLNQGGVGPTFAENTFQTTITSPTGVALGDLNQDGRLDFALSSSNSGGVDLFFNQSAVGNTTIQFLHGALNGVGTGATFLQLVDLNGDGAPDIVLASTGSNTVQEMINNTVVGSFTGTFTGPTAFSTLSGTSPIGLTAIDLNQDGKPDVVSANQATNDISVLPGQ